MGGPEEEERTINFITDCSTSMGATSVSPCELSARDVSSSFNSLSGAAATTPLVVASTRSDLSTTAAEQALGRCVASREPLGLNGASGA